MKPATDLATGPGVAPERQATLVVEGLSVRLGGREVLHDVSFSLGAGELAGLIGTNGAGKTTLLRALLGLQPIASGRVYKALKGPGRGGIGYVPQKVILDPDLPLRARDLVQLGMDGRRLGLPLPSSTKRRRAEELLAWVGAAHLADARVGTLSGGEQQRALIAHALATNPGLLLLDEPFANLDLRSTQETVLLLARTAREHGVTVLLSTHDVNPLLPVMDRVIYLAGGRAASGTTAEVVRSKVLSALYGHHVDVFHAHGRVIVSVGEEHRADGCEPGSQDPEGSTNSAEQGLEPRARDASEDGCDLGADDCALDGGTRGATEGDNLAPGAAGGPDDRALGVDISVPEPA